MSVSAESLRLQGGAGLIQALRDVPTLAPGQLARGVAVIAHPHPLFGGTMDNKVVQTLARAFVQAGWIAVRFNFRGVGESEGSHDAGDGEAQDLVAVVRQCAPHGALALAGFSFGAVVALRAVSLLEAERAPAQLVCVGTAVSRFAVPPLPPALHLRTLLLHGESDDTVPLADVLNWARPQNLPVTVLPGGGHFFHGQLPLLKGLVLRHLQPSSGS